MDEIERLSELADYLLRGEITHDEFEERKKPYMPNWRAIIESLANDRVKQAKEKRKKCNG